MVISEATVVAVLAGVLSVPLGDAEPPRTLRLAPEPGGVAAVDVPLRGELEPAARGRYRTPRMDTSTFSMVGVTWSSGHALLRVRVRTDGRWGAWQRAEPMPESPTSTELMWVGDSDGVQVESERTPAPGLQLTLIEPGADPEWAPARPQPGPDRRPELRSRKAWGADDRLRDGSPRYNRTIQQVHVHHTVNSNRYRRSDVPGLIRGIYRYHTQNLGWSDIGYNFLVDRYGRTWVGRAGGPGRPVRGAHTLGFNSTSTGVAVIGNFETARPWKRVKTAIVHLAAWKLAKFGRDPDGRVRVFSHGSDRYPAGRTVRLPVIDGHRDTNLTACPGQHIYEKLPNIRRRAAERVARFGGP